jgi:hypothetical protein
MAEQTWPIPDEEILRIQQEGRAAALRGDRPDACPYRPGSGPGEEADRFRQLMWIRSYRHARAEIEAARKTPPS